MIKVRYPVSGAGFEADVEGVGPTVALKQMYYRHRLDLSSGPQLCSRSWPSCLSSFLSFHYSLFKLVFLLLFSKKINA